MVRLAVNSDPVFATIWEDMGDVFYEKKDDSRALDCYEQCLSVLPERLEVLRKIGDLYRRMGKMESAIMAYEAVLQSNPTHSLAACGLDEIRKGL
jgi:tetratricopeptide (TPR) repeat protein